jgi:hypothetical protein
VNNALIDLRRLLTLGGAAISPSWELRLFTNFRVPKCDDTIDLYTECKLAGYTKAALVFPNWTGAIVNCVHTWNYPTQHFTFTAGGILIYGHLLYDVQNNDLGWVSLWDVAYSVPASGGNVDIALQWVDKQC